MRLSKKYAFPIFPPEYRCKMTEYRRQMTDVRVMTEVRVLMTEEGVRVQMTEDIYIITISLGARQV